MAEGKICVCPQCGKKFKLKPDFASASFACTGCSATVWVEGKPKGPSGTRRRTTSGGSRSPQSGRKKAATGGRSSRAAAGSGAGAGSGRGRRGKRPEPDDEQEEQGGRGSRYQQKNNSQNVIIAVVGLVLVFGVIAFLLMRGGDKKDDTQDNTANANGGNSKTSLEDTTDDAEGDDTTDEADVEDDESEGTDVPPEDRETATPDKETDTPEAKPEKPRKKLSKTKTKYRMEKDPKTGKMRKVRISRWNPPEDLGHLEDTPAEKKKEIDDLLTLVFDPYAGRDSLDAKQKLALIGKPAYLPVLAAIRDAKKELKWDNNHDDNVAMSSVKLADECLRLMDGYLEANSVGVIRPGTPQSYYDFVIRMHYKRWKQKLADMDTMPGPFDPSSEYEKETEESD
jgi:hypothetical protein